ncbi:MAG: hypothetical protein AAF975_02625 [Spirochaetota bacterium]
MNRLITYASFLCLASGSIFSCQSTYGSKEREEIGKLLSAGQFSTAAETHRSLEYSYDLPRDELLFHLNQSSLDYYASIIREGEVLLKSAAFERAEEMLRHSEVQQNSLAAHTRDNAALQTYTATLQENLWQNIFASLYYWNRDSLNGALVELRRNHEKVELYRQYARNRDNLFHRNDERLDFRNSALMQYLGMLYYRADRRWDDWRINRDELITLLDQSKHYAISEPKKLIPSERISAGNGAINLVLFTGRGVRKDLETVRIIKVPGGVALQLDGSRDAQAELGLSTIAIPALSANFSYYEMSIPVMIAESNQVRKISLRIDGGPEQNIYALENFAAINLNLFHHLRADILAKQVPAFILKVLASEAVQAALGNDNGAGFLAGLIGSALTTASQPQVDLRKPGFHPSVGWVGEFQVPFGLHGIELSYYGTSGLLHRKMLEVQVTEGKTQIIQDYYAR